MDILGLPSISDERFASCDAELIHVTESIQPHGTILGFRIQDFILLSASTKVAINLKADWQSFDQRYLDKCFG